MRPASLLLVIAFALPAQAATVEEVLTRLEETEKSVTTMKFDYVQSVQLAVTQQGMQSQGSASFQRPDRFRVELKGAEPQTFISDGITLWVYMPNRKQVLKQTMEAWAKAAGFPEGLAPFRLSTQEMRARYEFKVENQEAATPVLSLTPKSEGAYSMRMWVDMATGLPSRTELHSTAAKVVTEIKNAQVNPKLPGNLFRFSPPAGVEVLEMPFGSAQ